MKQKKLFRLLGIIVGITVASFTILLFLEEKRTVEAQTITEKDFKPELVVQTGHTSLVNSIKFSPDGKILASGGSDNSVLLWNIELGQHTKSLYGHKGEVYSVAFSPNGKILASADSEHKIKMWNIETGTEIKTLEGHWSAVNSLLFLKDGKTLVSGGMDNTIKIWNIETGTENKSLESHTDSVNSIALSPNGKMLASGSTDNTIKLWDIEFGTEIKTLEGHTDEVKSVAFSPDGKILVSGSHDNTIKIWNVSTGTVIRTIEAHTEWVQTVIFSPDGKTLASGSWDETVRLWNTQTGVQLQSLKINHLVSSITFSPDGKTVVSGSYAGEIRLWNTKTGTEIKSFIKRADSVLATTFSPNGKLMALATSNTIRIWNIETGQQTKSLQEKDVTWSVVFSPNGKTLASGNSKSVKLWNIETGAEIKTLNIPTENITSEDITSRVETVAFSPNGKILASGGSDQLIRLWNVENGQLIKTLGGHTEAVESVAFSPDGKIIASGSKDKSIILWNTETGVEIKPLAGHTSTVSAVSFSPNGKTLASASFDKTIKIWNVETGEITYNIWSEDAESLFTSVAFSPDGKTLASGSWDTTIKLIDVESGTSWGKFLKGHKNWVNSVTFSSDGFLLSGSNDATVKVWNVEKRENIATLVSLDKEDWVVSTPDERFDTNKNLDNVEGLVWVLQDQFLMPKPLDIFMRQYYEPGLLPRVLKCNEENNCDKEFKPLPSITQINRVQPKVEIKEIILKATNVGLVDVVVNLESISEVIGGKKQVSGVDDLRLFRDGQLVGISTSKDKLEKLIADAPRLVEETNTSGKLIDTPEDQAWRETNDIFKLKGENIKVLSPEKIQYTFRNIKLPKDGRKEVEFTAYAFNSDRVKSNTAQSKFYVSEAVANTPRKGRGVVLSIGVNASEIPKFNLRYAANDAKKMQEIVSSRLLADAGKYSEVISIPLISDYDANKKVTDNTARKAVIKGVFSLLAGNENEVPAEILAQIPNRDKIKEIQPEDTLIITYAGHGYADRNGIFYLLPFDVGTNSEDLSAVLRKSISSDELSLWMLDITAQEMIFIVDACNSAAAVQGTGFKPGPMGSRGLGQLAYDKGMRILAATQADNVALELNKIQQGLLSYALLQNGIIEKKADTEADFNQLSASEWLSYGVKRVPEIYEEVRAGKRTLLVDGNTTNAEQSRLLLQQQSKQKSAVNLQQPTLFDFSRNKEKRSLMLLP